MKDIYSPLEIDDQWDQRAPMVEGEGSDAAAAVQTPGVEATQPSATSAKESADNTVSSEAGYTFHPQEEGADNATDSSSSETQTADQPLTAQTPTEAPAGLMADTASDSGIQTRGTGLDTAPASAAAAESNDQTAVKTASDTQELHPDVLTPANNQSSDSVEASHDHVATPVDETATQSDEDAIESLTKAKDEVPKDSAKANQDLTDESLGADNAKLEPVHTTEKVIEPDDHSDLENIHGSGSFHEEFGDKKANAKKVDGSNTEAIDSAVTELIKVREGLEHTKTEAQAGIEKIDRKIEKSKSSIEASQAEIDREQERIDRLKEDKAHLQASIRAIETALKEDTAQDQELADVA